MKSSGGGSVVQLGILVGASAAVGLVWAAVVRALPQADPGRATSRRIGTELGEHPSVRGFLRARLDPDDGDRSGHVLAAACRDRIVFGVCT
jgi:hypothetical protein